VAERGERGSKGGLILGFIGRGEVVGVRECATKVRGGGSVAIKAISAAAVTYGVSGWWPLRLEVGEGASGHC
jgi:hypothetical protein